MSAKNSPYPPGKFIIALTGGIASGKGLVADTLEQLGASIVDTDILAREVVRPGSLVLEKIRKMWGDRVLKPDGSLDRAYLGSIIFSSPADRKKLNRIMHPEIRKLMVRRVKEDPRRVVVIVIPLLFEAEIPVYRDEAWLAYCSPQQQKQRLIERDRISPEEAQKRIDSQMPIDQKVKLCDVVIDNTDTREQTRRQVQAEWKKLQTRLPDETVG